MPSIYLTPASIGYLTQFILSGLIEIYLARRLFRRENRDAQSFLLAGFFAMGTIFIGMLFLDVVFLPTPRLYVVYLENPVLGFALVLMLQFAYRFPAFSPRRTWEAYVVLGVSLLYALYEAVYAGYRFSLLRQGIVEYRPPQADYALAVLLVWIPVAFLRQAVNADERSVHWLRKLWRPQGSGARGARDFALIYLLLPVLAGVNILRGISLVSTTFYNISLSVGILGVMVLFSATYLDHLSETTSFIVKLSGFTLTLLLAVLGIVGWVVLPDHIATYRPALADFQTLHFSPNARGGYDVVTVPFRFETDLGEKLAVTSRGAGRSQAVDFTFPFYGQTYSQVYVTSVGLLCMGEALYHPSLQNNYGHFPGIFPLLIDLEPSAGGGVFVRTEPDRLMVTWDHLPALYQPKAVFTFQAVLYRDGSFDFTYNGLPAPLTFDPDATPSANPWLRGVNPGLAGPIGQVADLSQTGLIGPQGMVQDFYMNFRLYLHQFIVPLAWLILGSSLFLLVGLPYILHASLVEPLQALLSGIKRMEDGGQNVQVPVRSKDEIGSLTSSFNVMTAKLHSLVTGLETSVAERTEKIQEANKQLRTEMAGREVAQTRLLQQQRSLATLEERERMGRDLHDGLGQVMGSINLQAQAAQTLLNDGQTEVAQANLERVVQMTQDAHTNIRNFILGLRGPSSSEASFFNVLEDYLRKFREETGVQASLSLPAEVLSPAFPPAVEEQILRVIQEALTNVRKHAAARKVEVLFSFDNRQAQMVISDDGVGFNPRQQPGDTVLHFGLNMMRERLEMVGGRLEVRSALGQGTRLLASIPRFGSVDAPQSGIGGKDGLSLRILLVDDSPIFLEGLRNLLMARGLTVVGLAHDGLEAQEKARLLRPDIIVMDVEMPGCNGLEATRAIKAGWPEAKIVMLSVSDDEENLFEAIKSGASGYLLKNLDANAFVDLLAGLARGEAPLTPNLAARLLAEYAHPAAPGGQRRASDDELTERQWQILDLASHGLAYKEIGSTINLSEATIKYHMRHILEHLHLESRIQAVAYARRVGKSK